MAHLHLMPLAFWIASALLLLALAIGWMNRRAGWGLPLIAVTGTVCFWYLGDALYNDYEAYFYELGPRSMERAWWQVGLFALTLLAAAGPAHRAFNKQFLNRSSSLLRFLETGATASDSFQRGLDLTCRTFAALWAALMLFALYRTDFDFQGLFLPFFYDKAQPWARGRVGGSLDAVISLAAYLQIFLAASFGVIAALSRRSGTQSLALAICLLTLPGFIFDRVRNAMLAVLLPGFLALVFLRLRSGTPVKLFLVLLGFVAIESWFRFVIENRDRRSITAAYQLLQTGEEEELQTDREKKHLGINMLEELGWTNYLIEHDRYHPNWGARYFAELVNPIPRALWKNKPLIGLDYAIARGFAWEGAEASEGGVAASISTGMIGQGVVNFGPWMGPIAAALLMVGWIAVLGRLDVAGDDIARLVLYMVGMVLTFNMGRDITLLVLYPFVFGYLILLWRNTTRGRTETAEAGPAFVPTRRPGRGKSAQRRRYHH
jgi:hypothetical protein